MVKKSKNSLKGILSRLDAKNKKIKGILFWKINPRNGKYIIIPAALQKFLIANNFCIITFFGGTRKIIKFTNNVIVFYNPQDVFNFCAIYVDNQKDENLKSEFLVQGEWLLITKKALLGSLPELELKPYKDTKNICLYFYNNTIVKVHSQGISLMTDKKFKKLNQYIFKSQIINRDFDLSVNKKSQFERFIEMVTNSEEHFLNVCLVIGYLLHRHKNLSIAKAVIITDVLSQATNTPHGRSGKGIIIQALSKLLNVTEYNGKNMDLRHDKFVYQSIAPDTDLFVIQDVGKGFDFEDLFSVITDSMVIEQKFKNKAIIDYADSPKIAVTTNYNIPDSSDSYKDRKVLLLLNNYFNANNKPEHKFENQFFTEWDENEYKAFDRFMMSCIEKYLKNGLIDYEDRDLKIQNLINSTSKQFVDIIEDREEYTIRDWYSLKKLADKLDINSNEPRVRSKVAMGWLQSYAAFKGLKYEDRVSNGVKKFCLTKKER